MITARRIAEVLARKRSFRRHLSARFGKRPVVVSPDAALRWLKPGSEAFEPILLELAETFVKPGSVVWDVGANVGAFAVPACHISNCTTVAIEADPFLGGLLRRTATLKENQDLDLRVVSAAVSDKDGVDRFAIAGRGRAASGLVDGFLSTQHGATRQLLWVPTLRIDTLLMSLPAPALMKVDIEGAELLLLEGASTMLGQVKPTLYIEVSSHTSGEVRSRLASFGYSFFDGDRALTHLRPAGPDTVNLLALTAV